MARLLASVLDLVDSSQFNWCGGMKFWRNRPGFRASLTLFVLSQGWNPGACLIVRYRRNIMKRHFYENCSENDCKMPRNSRQKGRVDPMLKLYPNCPMMFTKNHDVLNGQANGSRVRVKKIKTKPGETPKILKLDCGTKVQALLASQVESILVEHEAEDISPRCFHVTEFSWQFTTTLLCGTEDLNVSMKGKQFPLISNSCTTGHKLQGCSVEQILINDFHYQVNWPYVVLSRVRTMEGLFLREPLSTDLKKYRMNPKMKQMLETFRNTVAIGDLTEAEYDAMLVAELEDENLRTVSSDSEDMDIDL